MFVGGLGGAAGLFTLAMWLLDSSRPRWLSHIVLGLFVADLAVTCFLIATRTGGRDEIEGRDLIDDARRVLRERRDD